MGTSSVYVLKGSSREECVEVTLLAWARTFINRPVDKSKTSGNLLGILREHSLNTGGG